MVTEKYRFVGRDYGLLVIAFPHVQWIRPTTLVDRLFIPAKRIIVFSEQDPLVGFSEKEVIQVISTAPIAIDTRDGFLRFMASKGVRPTRHQLKQLLGLDDSDFWRLVKTAWLLKAFSNLPAPDDGTMPTMLDLFEVFFEDYGAVYRLYEQMKVTWGYRAIVLALITMMIKATDCRRRIAHPYYRRILEKNARYLDLFRRSLIAYLESPMNEIDFLSLAARCTQHTRTPDL